MKRIIVILCFAVGFSTLNAQVVKSSSKKTVVQHVEKQKNTSKDNIWYLKGGLSFMSLIDDHSDGVKLGYKFDWGFKKTIKRLKTNDSFNPYWGMDFSLGSMGGKTYHYRSIDDGYTYGFREDKDETFAHCLQWSFLNLGMDFVLSPNVKLDIHAGGFLSLALLHKYHTEYKHRYNSYYTTYVDNGSYVYDDDYWFDTDSGVDLGFNLGIGLWVNPFNFEVGWQRSTVDWGIEGSNIIFKVGFAIPEKHNSANR